MFQLKQQKRRDDIYEISNKFPKLKAVLQSSIYAEEQLSHC